MRNISVRFTEVGNDTAGNTVISGSEIGEVFGENRGDFLRWEV